MKKLRRKIVLAVFASVTAVFLLTIAITSALITFNITERADRLTHFLNENDGSFPEKSKYDKMDKEKQIDLFNYNDESPYRIRYFVVKFDGGEIESVDIEHIAAVNESSARLFAEIVKAEESETGNYLNFRYRYSEETGYAIFIDCTEDYDGLWILVIIMAIVAALFILLITVVFHFISKRVVRPFEENSRMQKQFITDASHELKTPIAIISANAEVLSYKYGDNDWLNNITSQTERISGLINELLTLNRLEEIETNTNMESVDLSGLLNETIMQFKEVLSSRNITETSEIDDVTLNGNKEQLKRLCSVLIENASKYTSDNGRVEISLKCDSRYAYLNVFNTYEIDENADYKHLFDRFYRPDVSRTSSTGGHGIGLSIAKRIVTLHNGTIEAVPESDGLRFKAKLSRKIKANKTKR